MYNYHYQALPTVYDDLEISSSNFNITNDNKQFISIRKSWKYSITVIIIIISFALLLLLLGLLYLWLHTNSSIFQYNNDMKTSGT